ncbi:MAG: phage holin family protein [Candidatus Dasytiphilus stammeri]
MKNYQKINCHKVGLVKIVPRVLRTLVELIETRIFLIISELQESKRQIFHLLMLIGLTLFFLSFSLISLFFIFISLIDPINRLVLMIFTTSLLFLISLLSCWLTFYKIKKMQLLYWTYKELKKDSKFIEE